MRCSIALENSSSQTRGTDTYASAYHWLTCASRTEFGLKVFKVYNVVFGHGECQGMGSSSGRTIEKRVLQVRIFLRVDERGQELHVSLKREAQASALLSLCERVGRVPA